MIKTKRPLLIIDGGSFAHWAYHGLPKTMKRKGDRPQAPSSIRELSPATLYGAGFSLAPNAGAFHPASPRYGAVVPRTSERLLPEILCDYPELKAIGRITIADSLSGWKCSLGRAASQACLVREVLL